VYQRFSDSNFSDSKIIGAAAMRSFNRDRSILLAFKRSAAMDLGDRRVQRNSTLSCVDTEIDQQPNPQGESKYLDETKFQWQTSRKPYITSQAYG